MRHGPHHAAQKSTSTGTRAEVLTSSNSVGSALIGTAGGGSLAGATSRRAGDVCRRDAVAAAAFRADSDHDPIVNPMPASKMPTHEVEQA